MWNRYSVPLDRTNIVLSFQRVKEGFLSGAIIDNSEPIELRADLTNTILMLKERLSEHLGIESGQLRLYARSAKQLEDSRTLESLYRHIGLKLFFVVMVGHNSKGLRRHRHHIYAAQLTT